MFISIHDFKQSHAETCPNMATVSCTYRSTYKHEYVPIATPVHTFLFILLCRYEEEVAEARRKGISGVPFFEISLVDYPQLPVHSMSGAQPVKTFVLVFQRLQSHAKM